MINLSTYFIHKNCIKIGRTQEHNDVVLDSTLVSRQHCSITKNSENSYTLIENSKNGTYINGIRIQNTSIELIGDEQIIIGVDILYLTKPPINNEIINVHKIKKQFKDGKIGLHEQSFKIKEGDFCLIMGPSGCGKSTLLKSLARIQSINKGTIEIFGLNISNSFSVIKHLIGYVPQDDIVNKELSVIESLWFSAKLRIPNLNDSKFEKIKNEVLNAVNLNNDEILNTKISNLSGGQRKRLCIATELLSSPKILFLDEPTSPLDPETIEDFLQCLKNLTLNGVTILMVSHKPEDLLFADKVIWMAKGGYLVFCGEVNEYLNHFSVKRTTELYSILKIEDNGFKFSKIYNDNFKNSIIENGNLKDFEIAKPNYWNQYILLTKRYLKIKWNDKKNLAIQIIQAPIIGFLLSIIFYNGITIGFLFMLVVSAIWFGIANSSKEIVDEKSVFARERQFNIRIAPYILSKLTVLGLIGFLQIFVLLLSVNSVLYFKNLLGLNLLIYPFLLLNVVYFGSTLIGLLLSSIVNNSEKAMSIQPLMLIPQIVLAGIIYPLKAGNGIVAFLSLFTISRWGTQGLSIDQNSISNNQSEIKAIDALSLPDNFNLWQHLGPMFSYHLSIFIIFSIVSIAFLFYALTFYFILKKDKIK